MQGAALAETESGILDKELAWLCRCSRMDGLAMQSFEKHRASSEDTSEHPHMPRRARTPSFVSGRGPTYGDVRLLGDDELRDRGPDRQSPNLRQYLGREGPVDVDVADLEIGCGVNTPEEQRRLVADALIHRGSPAATGEPFTMEVYSEYIVG